MPIDSSDSLKISREKRSYLTEVCDIEKRLWSCIHSKGVLHSNVQDLYHKACCLYEKLFLNNNELGDLQNIEYLLWRLHYKHIDEFRKRITQNSVEGQNMLGATNQKKVANKEIVDVNIEGFRSFLSEATKFYQDLIRKIKTFYGLLDEPWFYKNDGVSGRIEWKELHKCQFVTHRLCICLGDLARYQELYEKPNSQQRNWCAAASYYLEAAKIYPDGGNPQNQLAVLATYIGDDFLALYHCIRSLAVKEPFQDALQNLILLFERNRSINIISESSDEYDFYKPSEWISIPNKAGPSSGTFYNNNTPEVAERDLSDPTDVWTRIIRTFSFFFLDPSLESFPSTYVSSLKALEALLALHVTKLSSALESYRNMNLSKAGPYRALHIISVLLFIIHNLSENRERRILKPINETQQSMLVKLALTVTFTFMGRFVDRCLKGSPVRYFPLLPPLLVFVEWLVEAGDKVDVDDGKCESARCYFFASFVDLLNQLRENEAEITSPNHIALWEDYELRGFILLSKTHDLLDFSRHWEEEINYKMKNEYRAHRIVQAATKIAKRSALSAKKWLFYDDQSRKFSTTETKDNEKQAPVEEEEDIVFKPIIRHNSEPIQIKEQQKTTEGSDDSLRRSSSVLVAQNRAIISSLTSTSPILSPSPSKQHTQNEHPIAAGPPSLSSWVLNGENLSAERKKNRDVNRSVLKPIMEMDSDDFMKRLSLSTTESCGSTSAVACPSSCSAASPPASPQPSNLVWFISAPTPEPASFSGSPRVNLSSFPSEIPLASPHFPSLIDHSTPWSSPQFPDQQAASRPTNGSNFSSSFNLFNPWNSSSNVYIESTPPLFLPSSSLLHGLQNNQQRQRPYASPGMSDMRPAPEPQPLLQYLKEREWQLQQESPFTGSPYMRN
ncbi:unnamed protein product [Amaranthus hypochondriacus]